MIHYLIEGGFFMWPILILWILGLGISIERFYTLIRASVNTKKFMEKVRKALHNEGVQSAVEVCAKTRGPVAEIFHAGLSRLHRGIDAVEKGIQSAGSLETAFLEKNMVWLNTVVSLAPLLGFTGTVQGMIIAFDDIEKANDISPSIVAHGIAVALLTTIFGLVVAMSIQTFQNWFISRVDKLIVDMEENSVHLIDELLELESQGKLKEILAKK